MAYSIREAFTGFRQGQGFVEFFYRPWATKDGLTATRSREIKQSPRKNWLASEGGLTANLIRLNETKPSVGAAAGCDLLILIFKGRRSKDRPIAARACGSSYIDFMINKKVESEDQV